MTDFEMLNGRPAWCEGAIAAKTAKKLAKLARKEDEKDIDEDLVALSVAKACAFNKALLQNAPKGLKDVAKQMAAQALAEFSIGSDTIEAPYNPEIKCHNCRLCKQRIIVVKNESGVVRSFMTTPMIQAGSIHL